MPRWAKRVLCTGLLFVGFFPAITSATAQNTATETVEETREPPPIAVIPPPNLPMERVASPWASVERVKTVDIPQWAKEAGHNGRATFTASVDADGQLVGLELVTSSMSDAIDNAVRARAEALKYGPAKGSGGEAAPGVVHLTMSYAGFDKDSPGGGLDNYTCGHMVREHDWFLDAHAGGHALFVPKFVYLISEPLARLERGEDIGSAQFYASAEKRAEMWEVLVIECRADPEKLLIEQVDFTEMYRRQVDSR